MIYKGDIMVRCIKCGKKMKRDSIDYELNPEKITIHDVPVYKCSNCGHVTMNINQAENFYEILERVRGSAKPALILRRSLSHDSKSMVLRIPKDVERMLGMNTGDKVNIWVDGKRMIVEKAD
jgi:YgiT-type zinc finger domain-containing protein